MRTVTPVGRWGVGVERTRVEVGTGWRGVGCGSQTLRILCYSKGPDKYGNVLLGRGALEVRDLGG